MILWEEVHRPYETLQQVKSCQAQGRVMKAVEGNHPRPSLADLFIGTLFSSAQTTKSTLQLEIVLMQTVFL